MVPQPQSPKAAAKVQGSATSSPKAAAKARSPAPTSPKAAGKVQGSLPSPKASAKVGSPASPLPKAAAKVQGPAPPSDAAVLHYIRMNDVNTQAANALCDAAPSIQKIVMQRDCLGTRDPSAILLCRIRDAVAAATPAHRTEPASLAQRVDAFIDCNKIDARAAHALRDCGPAIQEVVINRGGLETVRCASSALLGRIRDAQEAGQKRP